MYLRRAIHLGLALLVAAGLNVCGSAAAGPSKASKPSGSSASGKSHRPAKKNSRRKERGQTAPTGDRISEIQQALSKNGSFSGTANGKWDDPTVQAMKKFQGAHGLNPSGKLDAPTLQKLGLGSQTAGVAAPILPANSSSKLVSSSMQSTRQ
jgi:peptidoglycan hydrolase-like protein with peptidoglycan-binding domain